MAKNGSLLTFAVSFCCNLLTVFVTAGKRRAGKLISFTLPFCRSGCAFLESKYIIAICQFNGIIKSIFHARSRNCSLLNRHSQLEIPWHPFRPEWLVNLTLQRQV